MSRKMTVVFHDEDLYTYLKVEAARNHMPASEIISDAVREWLESRDCLLSKPPGLSGKRKVAAPGLKLNER